jgi:hypothetical protein
MELAMKNIRGVTPLALLGALLSALSGCGGGDSAGDNSVYAPAAAWRNLHSSTHSWTLSGNYSYLGSSGAAGLTITETVVADGAFPATGEVAKRRLWDSVPTFDGTPVTGNTGINYYRADGSLLPLGGTSDGACAVTTSLQAIPENATLGQSGLIANMSTYDSCSPGANLLSTSTVNWAVEKIGNRVYVCEVTNTAYNGASSTQQESDCYQMADTAGTLGAAALVSVSASDGNATVYTLDLSTP